MSDPQLPSTPQPPPFGAPSPWSAPGQGPTYVTPTAGEMPTGDAPKRSKGKMFAALGGVAALVAAGAFAVVKIGGSDDDGGAGSPTEVGQNLMTALDNEDMLGAIDLLLPGERDTFRQPFLDFLDNMRRLEVVSSGASGNSVSGIDIQVTDVVVKEQPTNVDDITNIRVSGTATATVNGDELPIGDLLLEKVFNGERPEVPDDADAEPADFDNVGMTTVERDGKWYLSLFYTAADSARGDAEIPDEGLVAKGADSPEGAVADMLDALSALDVRQMIELLDPTEAEALQRYAPLFIDDAERGLSDNKASLEITDAEYSVKGSGSRRTVGISSMTIEAGAGDEQVTIDWDGDCVSVSSGKKQEKVCRGDGGSISDAIDQSGVGDPQAAEALFDAMKDAFEDYEYPGVAVHEVDGQWYVSPLRSWFDGVNGVLSALDRDEIEDLSGAFGDYFDSIRGRDGGGLDLPFDDDGPTPSDTVDVPSPNTYPPDETSPTDDTMSTDDTFPTDDTTFSSEAYSNCIVLDAADGIPCMLDGIEQGTIDPMVVSVPVLYPECGLADIYWAGDQYALSDGDFTAMVDGAAKCFEELIAEGTVDPYTLPPELAAPECLKGKNWYAQTDDSYVDAFYDCYFAKSF